MGGFTPAGKLDPSIARAPFLASKPPPSMSVVPDLSSFQAVVFDMDGTLVDSEGHYCRAYIHAVEHFGGALTPDAYCARFAGQSDKVIDQLLHIELEGAVEVATIRATRYAEYARLRATLGVPLLPGALELLDHLATIRLPLAVASAAERRDIETNLALADIRPRFAALASGEEVPHTKPAPDVYLLAAQRLGVDPARCLAFEDTNSGARAALAAGMTTIMVPHQCEPDDFVRGHAHGIAGSLVEIVHGLR
jgi:HAD superfamily hydrolase (TIGR01509 family)